MNHRTVRHHTKVLAGENYDPKATQYDVLIQYFMKTKDIRFQVLWDAPLPGVNNSNSPPSSRIIAHTLADQSSGYEEDLTCSEDAKDILSMCQQQRLDEDVDPNDKIFISVA